MATNEYAIKHCHKIIIYTITVWYRRKLVPGRTEVQKSTSCVISEQDQVHKCCMFCCDNIYISFSFPSRFEIHLENKERSCQKDVKTIQKYCCFNCG